MPLNRIRELALIIVDKAADVDDKLQLAGLSTPSFNPRDASSLLQENVAESRTSLLEATEELHALMLGPVGLLTSHTHAFLNTLQAIYRFQLALSFPEGKDEATFEEISQRSGLSVSYVQRILRHAMTYRIFREPRKGTVAHTAASMYLATNLPMREWIGMVSEELWPAASKTVEAMVKWPDSEEPNHSGFNLAHNTKETLFGELAKYPNRQARYVSAMTWFGTAPGLEPTHIVHGFPWETLGSGTVVDIGGSHGGISVALAQSFPSLHFIVQEQAVVVQEGRAKLPTELQGQVAFMEHNFFSEQPIKSADVYLLRWILHDWPDAYGVKILRALIPALKHGARICICENILPEPGTLSPYQARELRTMDLAMLQLHNAKERDVDDWDQLLHRADARFHIVKIRQPSGSRLSVIEVCWLSHSIEAGPTAKKDDDAHA